jgi:predicted metal-dependent phosphoesterase TrpH
MKRVSVHEKVQFERPKVQQIRDSGFHAVDMHFHTNHSDAYTTVRSALALAKRRGVGLAITDHNTASGALEASRMQTGVLLIPGMEISVEDGPHILLFFYDLAEMVEFYHREIERRKGKSPYLATTLSTEDLLECTSRYNCVRAAAHPYGYLVFNRGVAKCVEKGYLGQETLSRFDALEVLNGGMTRTLNRKASDLAVKLGLGLVGGTDGHILRDLGRVLTCAESADVDGFLSDIVHRQTFVVGHEKNLIDKGLTAALLMTRYVPYTGSSLVVHYRQNLPRIQRFLRGKAKRSSRTRTRAK